MPTTRGCTHPGCANPHHAQDLCQPHYYAWWYRTRADRPKPGTHERDLLRYLSKVSPVPTDTGCYLWTGALRHYGHGAFSAGGKSVRAHRWLYQHVLSVRHPEYWPPLVPGQVVRHRCDVPACQTPTHLEAGTPADNTADMIRRGRCSIITIDAEMAEAIRTARAGGATYRQLAAMFSVSRASAHRVVTGQLHPAR